MTVEKARKILGNCAESLPEKEILEIIDSFNAIIEVGFRQFERKHKIQINTEQAIKN